jgi:penicillin-binding protein 1A
VAARTADKVPSRRKKSASSPLIRWVKRILALLTMVMLIGIATILYLFLQATKEAESEIGNIEQKFITSDPKATTVVSADGQILWQLQSENRKPFKLSDVPQSVRNAFLAAEDRRFYSHPGVDPIGLARVVFLAAKEGKASQGGSTLTMQLAKLFVNGSEHTFGRKLKDIAVATQLEKLKTKDQILELYLQRVYFGEGAHGLASAAETYFGKEISELTLGEAAMLARCVRRPSSENPLKNLDRSLQNRNVVLSIMLQDGQLTNQQYEAAMAEKPKLNTSNDGILAMKPRCAFFVDDVLRRIKIDYPDLDIRGGGYRIETTIRTDIQEIAEKAVRQVVNDHRRDGVSQGAFVLVNRDGQILCEVGGVSYERSQWNIVTQSKRPPGSSFKPIVYATALATGALQPNQSISNAPIRKKDRSQPGGYWVPKNDSRRENAPYYSLDSALASSINLCAIHAIEMTGVNTVVNYARDTFGIRSKLDPTEPLALGASSVSPIEMAEAYSVFMLRGDRLQPTSILRIIGPDGQVIASPTATRIPGVLDPGVCDVIDRALAAVVAYGTGTTAAAVPNARGKTGTTSSHRDAWFCGYSDGLVGVGWVGNSNYSPMSSRVYGGKVTIDFWRDIMLAAHQLNLHQPTSLEVSHSEIQVKPAAPPAKPESQDSTDDEVADPDANAPIPNEEGPLKTPVPPLGNVGDPASSPGEDPAGSPIEAPNAFPGDEKTVPPDETSTEIPPANPPKAGKKPKSRKREAQSIEVEICADSGLRATMYCQETVIRKYAKGSEPKRFCPIHRGGQ